MNHPLGQIFKPGDRAAFTDFYGALIKGRLEYKIADNGAWLLLPDGHVTRAYVRENDLVLIPEKPVQRPDAEELSLLAIAKIENHISRLRLELDRLQALERRIRILASTSPACHRTTRGMEPCTFCKVLINEMRDLLDLQNLPAPANTPKVKAL